MYVDNCCKTFHVVEWFSLIISSPNCLRFQSPTTSSSNLLVRFFNSDLIDSQLWHLVIQYCYRPPLSCPSLKMGFNLIQLIFQFLQYMKRLYLFKVSCSLQSRYRKINSPRAYWYKNEWGERWRSILKQKSFFMIEKLTDGLLRFFNILIMVYDEVNPNIPEEFHRCFNNARWKHSRMSEKREQKHSTHAVANFFDTCFLHIFHPVGVEKIIFFKFKDKTFFDKLLFCWVMTHFLFIFLHPFIWLR